MANLFSTKKKQPKNILMDSLAEQQPKTPQPQTTGVYNKEKGGYVTPTTTYPTTNPDFVPSAKGTTTQIQFNKDGTIDYTPKGSTEAIKLSKEEYKVLQGGEGNVTNKVQQARQQVPQTTNPISLTPEQQQTEVVPQEPIPEAVGTAAGAIAGGIAGAGTGAAIGSVVPGIGTAIGAAIGGTLGAIGGAFTKISLDKRGDVRQAFTVGKVENTNFGQIIDYVNAGGDVGIARKRFAESKANLYSSQRFLKRETDTQLDRFVSDGADELAKVNDYVADLEQYYEPEFLAATLNPTGKVKYAQTNLNSNIETE